LRLIHKQSGFITTARVGNNNLVHFVSLLAQGLQERSQRIRATNRRYDDANGARMGCVVQVKK
jgi:hypothetical protein